MSPSSMMPSSVKANILDTLSCAFGGSSAPAIAEVAGLVRDWGGKPEADMFVFVTGRDSPRRVRQAGSPGEGSLSAAR